jgi:hypothetical protein
MGILLALGASLVLGDAHAGNDAIERALRAREDILGLDLDDARRELEAADPDHPAVLIEKGRLALYEADCDGATALLTRPSLAKEGPVGEEVAQLLEIARGCARVTASIVGEKDNAQQVEVRFQDEHDRALTPLIVETVVKARDALSKDLGVTWPRPTRIIVVRDLLSLSAMTGLPYKSAQTTGTVAVAKWGRVTLLSPRASQNGYAWRDTIAHELTHLAVTRATRDRAPLWLQEGVAKREEVRWRAPGPFDDRPSPDAIATQGIARKLDLPLDQLGPSIAMLPSANAALVAFAEVTSFVRYYAANAGDDALPKLLKVLRDGKEPDAALAEASGTDLKGWDVRWRAYLASRPHEPLPAIYGLGTGATDDKQADDKPDPHYAADLRDLRDRSRLAELLLARDHAGEAIAELDRLKLSSAQARDHLLTDPSLRSLRAHALDAAGRTEEARPLLADPNELPASYGPWWAIRGRLARARGEENVADPSFVESVAADPFGPEGVCEGITKDSTPTDPKQRPLCDAARAWRESLAD